MRERGRGRMPCVSSSFRPLAYRAERVYPSTRKPSGGDVAMGFERWRYVLSLRFRSLLWSSTAERELDEELRYHIDRQTEINVARGMGSSEARSAALRAMGGVDQHKEACRDQRRVAFAENIVR